MGRSVLSKKFIHGNNSNPIHCEKGVITVYGAPVRLEASFEVGPGKKTGLFSAVRECHPVHSDHGIYILALVRLVAFKDTQNYELPKVLGLMKFIGVVFW